MNRILTFCIISVAALGLASCSNDAPESDAPARSIKLSPVEEEVCLQNNKFAWNFLKTVVSENQGENIIISPLSLNASLSMLANGANGATYDCLVDLMGYNGYDIATVNDLYQKLTGELCSLDPKVKLEMANSLWMPNTDIVSKDFSNLLANRYNSDIKILRSGSFVKDVNSWCEEKTHGQIRDFLPQGTPLPMTLLVNTVYFKGKWAQGYKFDPARTRNAVFHNADGSQAKVPFMNKEMNCPHSQYEGFRISSIPFGNGNFYFSVILPDDNVSFDACIDRIVDMRIWQIVPSAKRNIQVSMPKLDINHSQLLNEALRDMGATYIFTDNADFSNIYPGYYVGTVKQSAAFKLDEDGAEAAAVTGINNLGSTGNIGFKVDHPYIFTLSEGKTGCILFMGCVNKF